MDYNRRKEQALKNAEASLLMEDLHPSAELEEALRRVLDGQMTEEAYLAQVFRNAARKGT